MSRSIPVARRSWCLRVWYVLLSFALAAGCRSGGPAGSLADKSGRPGATAPALAYPKTRTVSHVDEYHGTTIADPYRWLEEYTPETEAWIEEQNRVTESYLSAIPERARIRARLTELWNYERYGIPFVDGGRYFYTRNDGLQDQSVLYVADGLEAAPRILIDPNLLAADGTMALTSTSVSPDGRWLAYGLAEAGSDWNTIRLRDVATGNDAADELRWVKFSGADWSRDSKGFYYSRYDEPKGDKLKAANHYQKIYYHAAGTPQSEDLLVYERKDQPEWYLWADVAEAGDYLAIGVSPGDKVETGLFYRELGRAGAPIVELFARFDAQYYFVGNDGPVFWVKTDLAAPRWRLVAVDIRNPAPEAWKEIIPQAAESMEGLSLVGDRFIATYLQDARSVVRVFDLAGKPQKGVDLPGTGTASGFGGERSDKETFYSFGSYTRPPTIYRYEIGTGTSTLFREPKVKFSGTDYMTEQVFFRSKDGTRVPMFITHRKGIARDGSHPTILYGYGGFSVPLTPNFSPGTALWLEMGGVYAVANLRGGSEYGEEWHQGGMRLKKQNVFDDFIAAAEWLVAKGYTSSERLGIQGGSNGGLLVGACMTQRPDLFAACAPAVGVMDMLRFHTFTVGWGWVGDYGSSANLEEFQALRAYSPYHNLKPGTSYPATIVTTGDHDDRVHPAHSFKFAAALQAAQAGPEPALIRVNTRAGHGAGMPVSKRIEESADVLAFLAHELGLE